MTSFCSTQTALSLHSLPSPILQARCGTVEFELAARLRGRTATQRSKIRVLRGSGEWVLRRVLRRGPFSVGFTVKDGSEKGSQKGF